MNAPTPQSGRTPAARPRRGPHRSPEAHAAVLEVTRELLEEVGYPKVTMERIAERAGVARMTLYRWWPNKAAVVREAIADRLTVRPAPDTGSVRDDALTLLLDLVQTLTLIGNPRVMAGLLVELGESGRAQLRDFLSERLEPAAVLLRRGIDRGELPADLKVRAVVDSWAGYVLYLVMFQERKPARRDLADLVGLLPFRTDGTS
ncbi:TetR/AcrR family transcriptional regulator [Streptomyces muensis]|uniref:TetR/AcrR family transcriptional regulator n=1 Tax=Streptomyces muensis TaxID=1077944 RepID=A0A9X1TQH8_STRM4|nr:TetR/AcrR family transcriptional regulator [Streptomyces muensis]MCF1592603.1 TetR/AcrR family transcriptional regulator [Streptomyces muensis]